ncbi:MAG: dihydrolipoyl dehydrogenase [Acidiferrobacterales bacterium]|nr:dihydrolipoyl dehydrogenase [Acidiferrobacterales bacterium]
MSANNSELRVDVAVLGSGPGGYTAAFRAADLGKKTVLIERYPQLGGVCLNVGCIPSKALLHVAKIVCEAAEIKECGVLFGEPEINHQQLRKWVDDVIGQLTGGLAALAKQRGVEVVTGVGQFASSDAIDVVDEEHAKRVYFRDAIVAAGSRPASLPFLPDDPRIVDSTGALSLQQIPKRLLIVGGGIIGLELATVYHELGTAVTIVEILDSLIAEADRDIVKPLTARVKRKYENILLKTTVTSIDAEKEELIVEFEDSKGKTTQAFDMILSAVGRVPNGKFINAKAAGLAVDERGFIPVDAQQRTNVDGIYAIGDITGNPMLAHRATHQGKVAAEVLSGLKSGFDTSIIPSVAYTDPEIAWVGVTEKEAKQFGIPVRKSVFPWRASGRALSMSRPEGVTKLLFDPDSDRLIGAGISGPNAGELIAEAALAIEMGSDAEDLALTIHAHPTLSETINFAAEVYQGTVTDIYIPRKSARQER